MVLGMQDMPHRLARYLFEEPEGFHCNTDINTTEAYESQSDSSDDSSVATIAPIPAATRTRAPQTLRRPPPQRRVSQPPPVADADPVDVLHAICEMADPQERVAATMQAFANNKRQPMLAALAALGVAHTKGTSYTYIYT
jgi:hypothetical protein